MSLAVDGAGLSAEARLRRYVSGCIVVAVLATAAVVVGAAGGQPAAPSPWLLGLLWVVTVAGRAIPVALPVRWLGGVRESTNLVEIAAVLVIVLLDPAWAVAIVVTANVVTEVVVHRNDPRKIVFNTASEVTAVAVAGSTFHLLGGVPFGGSPRGVAVALLAAGTYILVSNVAFVGLVGTLSGEIWRTVRSSEMRSTLLVSSGIATTGVMAAVLAVEAPAALPLVAVPAFLDHLHARGRNETLELAAAKTAADRANRAKSEFLSRMSHEMRTPLNAILGFGQLLEMDADLDVTAEENVGYIMRSGRHLLSVIDEVLDLSQVEAGRLTLSLETFDAGALAKESLDLVRPLADQRGIRLDLVRSHGQELHVSADPQRLRQVLLNLLSNAVKYNRDAGTVTVSVGRTADRICIAVADTGDGIAAGDLERLFVPFERLHAGSSDVQGTGLGLSVSRRFVEAMEGRLDVTSEVGRGSTFTVLLPQVDRVA